MRGTRLIRLFVVSVAVGFATPGAAASEPSTDALATLNALAARIDSASSVRVAGTVYVKSTSGKSVPCDWECTFDARGRYRETVAVVGCDDVKTYQYAV